MYATIGLIIFMWVPALVVIIRNIAHHTYIWQIKEYRLDRIISQLRYKEENSLKGNWLNIIQVFLLIGSIVFFLSPTSWLLVIPALTLLSYTYEALNSVEELRLGRFIRPKKSIRNFLIFGFSFLTLLLPIILPINFTRNIYIDPEFESATIAIENQRVDFEDFLVQKNISQANAEGISLAIAIVMLSSALILISDLVSPFITSFFAITTEPLAQYKRLKMINASKEKIKKHKAFRVIGITGSFGKTTTKELLYYLIKDNYKTAITDKNYNSTVGIAQSVLKNLEPDTEVFIAEMGAYRKGEIKNSCKILTPNIAIVTGLIEQHVSLFGSIEKLFEAKFELIEALKSDGLAIFNGNNRLSLQMAAKTTQRKVTYKLLDEAGKEEKNEYLENDEIAGEIYAKNINKTEDGFRFDLTYRTASYPVKIKLQGKHNIENLLASVAAALELGMDLKTIVAKLNTTEPPQVYLRTFNGYNEALIIDDSYNSNSIGFKKALQELKDTHGRRRLVISKGIIELGKERDKIYQEIAKEFEGIDVLVTTDKKLSEWVEAAKVKVILVKDNFELFRKVLNEATENDVVLLEGALPEKLINTLIEPNN
ncbi:UDP-N-acetylmuramoyl-tripeptide--D-alanyl-D-alanine ligase [Candidatus Dojkabacteria bacterium]|nr:UDP-N-acetylmuramoyl-tripeptide--D-alanyl-D-alanine ligase [Candidatus Dojkabacteria bacterium]